MAGVESKKEPGAGYGKLPAGQSVRTGNVIKKSTVIIGQTEKFTFFFGAESPFSNWYPCKFTMPHPLPESGGPTFRVLEAEPRVQYNCSEQRMMHAKACEFGDGETAGKIMKSASPRFQKRLGRKIKNYVDARWCHVRTSIVKEALVAKFEQNPPLMALLLKAEGCFVEASPYDKIWGIGLAANSPQARNRATWKGTNLLGCILDDVRADFIKKGWELNERGAAIQKS